MVVQWLEWEVVSLAAEIYKQPRLYAILDIETTGGKYNEEGITEIAIYKYDGHQITDQFISLVNPERDIQPFVVNLTGINNKMLRNAPKFYEIAKRIVEITKNCIVVAHNVLFDYRILSTEFRRLGFDFTRETLCTVSLSKTLIPDQKSYSLGKLTRSLGIPMSDRHRASGDAQATVKLFKLLIDKDLNKEIIKSAVKKDYKNKITPKLLNTIKALPSVTGVYYMYNSDGEIIYIGKSKNIKQRVNQHFINTSTKAKKMQLQVASITYQDTGSELIALLKESEEIKRNQPIFNRALKHSYFSHGLYAHTDSNGYINLSNLAVKTQKERPITTFTNSQNGKRFILKMVENYELCLKLTGIDKTATGCFNYNIKQCLGACLLKESASDYNKRVNTLISNQSFENKSILIIDKGRSVDERSAVLIKDGIFKGIGFFNLNHQINTAQVLESLITPMEHNKDHQHIIQNYIRKNKKLKIITL